MLSMERFAVYVFSFFLWVEKLLNSRQLRSSLSYPLIWAVHIDFTKYNIYLILYLKSPYGLEW